MVRRRAAIEQAASHGAHGRCHGRGTRRGLNRCRVVEAAALATIGRRRLCPCRRRRIDFSTSLPSCHGRRLAAAVKAPYRRPCRRPFRRHRNLCRTCRVRKRTRVRGLRAGGAGEAPWVRPRALGRVDTTRHVTKLAAHQHLTWTVHPGVAGCRIAQVLARTPVPKSLRIAMVPIESLIHGATLLTRTVAVALVP